MSTPRFEAFLARLYTDPAVLRRFLDDPMGTARRSGLDTRERDWLRDVDRAGLVLASESFRRKRASRSRSMFDRLLRAIRRRSL